LTKTNNTFVTISGGQMGIINFGLSLSQLPIIYTGSDYQTKHGEITLNKHRFYIPDSWTGTAF